MPKFVATKIETRTLAGHFGAEIIGVDFSRPLDPQTIEAIRDVWIQAGIVLFRGKGLDDEAQMRLSQVFGELEASATPDLNDPDNKFIMTLAYDPNDKNPKFAKHYNVGGTDRAGWLGWHWDQAFMPTIVRGAVLRMVEPSLEMGETGFIDAVDAYGRLDPKMKGRIEELEVVYEFNPDFASGQFGFPKDIRALPGSRLDSLKFDGHDFPPVVHPLVITQRETGRKVLKLSPMHARYVLGMERDESDALLRELADHLVDHRFAYFHEWQANDMLAWDNWRIVHMANGVPLHCRRYARRTTISGDYAVGRYLDSALVRDREATRLVD